MSPSRQSTSSAKSLPGFKSFRFEKFRGPSVVFLETELKDGSGHRDSGEVLVTGPVHVGRNLGHGSPSVTRCVLCAIVSWVSGFFGGDLNLKVCPPVPGKHPVLLFNYPVFVVKFLT